MSDDRQHVRRAWRIPDALWARIQPVLPPRKPHPLGCHRPRVDDRRALDAIFFVLRTGGQWNALHHPGIGSSRTAHRRVQAWSAAGVCWKVWKRGVAADEALNGSDWEWRAREGAMTTAPLGGGRRAARTRPIA